MQRAACGGKGACGMPAALVAWHVIGAAAIGILGIGQNAGGQLNALGG